MSNKTEEEILEEGFLRTSYAEQLNFAPPRASVAPLPIEMATPAPKPNPATPYMTVDEQFLRMDERIASRDVLLFRESNTEQYPLLRIRKRETLPFSLQALIPASHSGNVFLQVTPLGTMMSTVVLNPGYSRLCPLNVDMKYTNFHVVSSAWESPGPSLLKQKLEAALAILTLALTREHEAEVADMEMMGKPMTLFVEETATPPRSVLEEEQDEFAECIPVHLFPGMELVHYPRLGRSGKARVMSICKQDSGPAVILQNGWALTDLYDYVLIPPNKHRFTLANLLESGSTVEYGESGLDSEATITARAALKRQRRDENSAEELFPEYAQLFRAQNQTNL